MFYAQSPACSLRTLRSVALGVTDPFASRDFYHEAWGLVTVDEDADRFWLRATGEEHHVLRLQRAEQNELVKVSFALGSRHEVDASATALVGLGVPLLREPGLLEDDAAGGYGLQLVDPEGRVLELSVDTYAVAPAETAGRRPMPRKIAHVVLNTADIDSACDFYTQVLGMRISDWSEHQMAFLRCGRDHHVIAFNQARWASVNHVAYEMASMDQFMRGIGNLKHHGIDPQWGPGRHGPGDNTFSYFTDPAGLVCEYTSEVAQVEEDRWLCRVWKRTPELSDQWGTAGPPTARIRTAMAGVRDAGQRGRVAAGRADYYLRHER